MGIAPRLARQLTQLTICSSAGSRELRQHLGSCPGPSDGPVRLCPAPLMARELANYCWLHMGELCWFNPNKAPNLAPATTMLQKLTDATARADYSALNCPCPLVLHWLLRCPRPVPS